MFKQIEAHFFTLVNDNAIDQWKILHEKELNRIH